VVLSRISLQYNARVKELRALGFRVVSRTEHGDGQVHGFFRLEFGPAGTVEPISTSQVITADSLFGDRADDHAEVRQESGYPD